MNLILKDTEQDILKRLIKTPDQSIPLIDHLTFFSESLSALLKSHYHAIVLLPGAINSEMYLVANNPPEFDNAYLEDLIDHDFILQKLTEKPDTIIHLDELLKFSKYRNSYFYREAQRLRPAGDCLYSPLQQDGEMIGFLGQVRPLDSAIYTDHEISLMHLITPVLAGQLQLLKYRHDSPLANKDRELNHNFQENYNLTPRETEILMLIIQGLTNKQLALKLNITVSTVKKHIYNIFEKTRVRNRTQLIFLTVSG